MSEKIKSSLSSFMKKQMNEKSSKIKQVKQANSLKNSAQNNKKNGEATEQGQDPNQEEMTEEEQLEEAKKASRNKAAEADQTEMFKKLILESIVKYTVIISVLVIFALGMIKFGPAIIAFFNGLMMRTLMGAIKGV